MSLDFSFKKYNELLNAICKSGYQCLTMSEYLSNNIKPERFILLRHDVDLDPFHQLNFAKAEAALNIQASYYFRHTPMIFQPHLLKEIHSMNHEVGYHYEVVTKARGDIKKAVEIFETELEEFRNFVPVSTVCPHGGSFLETQNGYSLKNMLGLIPKIFSSDKIFSHWDNFTIWNKINFQNLVLKGDAFHSPDYNTITYFSDTGRSWKQKFKRLDKVKTYNHNEIPIKNTDSLIHLIQQAHVKQMYILIHTEQWKHTFAGWLSWYLSQIIRRTGKKLIFSRRKHEKK